MTGEEKVAMTGWADVHFAKDSSVRNMAQESESRTGLSPGRQKVYGGLIIGLFALAIAVVLSVPFVYESQTLWYKVGMKKSMLRTGQMAGLLALLFLFVQVLLGARVKLLEKVFGAAALMRYHRANGLLVCFLAFSHAGLVLIPEGITNLPLGWKFWPEIVGGFLLLMILILAVSSQFRQQLGLPYPGWRAVHRLLGYFALCLVPVHVLFASESFARGVPKATLLLALAAAVSWLVQTKMAARRKQQVTGKK
jgi:DMSO/TMAO reductase YedYZ heme-binding membrane subunit